MKKLVVLLVGVMLTLSVQAQFKTVESGNSIKAKHHGLIPPTGKPINTIVKNDERPYEPQSLVFRKNTENGLSVMARSEDSRLPIFIEGNPEHMLRSGDSNEDHCFNFLENARGLMGIENPGDEFKIIKRSTDDLGMTHIKLQQQINDIPVYGAEIIYHTSEKKSFLNGRYQETPHLESYTPSLSIDQAELQAIEDVGGITKVEHDKFGIFDQKYVDSELVIYEGKLVYHFSIYKSIIERWEYFMDANTGEIIHKHTGMCKFHNHDSDHACIDHIEKSEVANSNTMVNGPFLSSATDLFGTTRQINTYEVNGTFYMIDASRTMFDNLNSDIPDNPVGAVWTIDAFNTSPQNSNFQIDHVSSGNSSFPGKATGVSAQYNGGQAYLYFKNIHDRESINGASGNVIGLINIADEDGSSLGNAFWNGTAMFYGNGDGSFEPLARGLDVAGHEMSHGVIQNTANLVYQGESGALNESFADVFGAMIDREDWEIGEDVVKASAFPSGALRSLQDPHNGAPFGSFNQGWQPKKYSERFTGTEDNGGVHINSGIPNHAFYLFASDPAVGKNRAEKVYYRALDTYLTASSKFIDARLAVVQAATDLYGTTVANKAKAAFDGVEIFNGDATNNQTDVEVNPGEDLILFTTEDQNNLYIADRNGNFIFNPLTEVNPISVPSVTDDGSEIIFVNENNELYYIRIDWSVPQIVQEQVIQTNDSYRTAVFSKDGLRLAALRDNADNEIFVFDFVSESGANFELFNPTFTEGVSTGDVLYADALQFDFTGEYLMYDAYNEIESTFGDNINYWDIGFIKIFNNSAGTFSLGSDIQKLFSQLPDGVSVGNPTFSKNSDYIVAFDYVEDGTFDVLGVNSETGDVSTIFEDNSVPGYPNYSNEDDLVIFDAFNTSGNAVIGAAQLEDNKIESTSASVLLGFQDVGVKWGVWFGNGQRALASEDELLPENTFTIFPNPSSEELNISADLDGIPLISLQISDMMGRKVYNNAIKFNGKSSIDISPLVPGQYVLTLITELGRESKVFVKQ